MSTIEVKVPDIGDFRDIPVIEVLVKAGDTVKAEDALVTLESDKATMDVPSPAAGIVREVRLKVGDKVSEGAVVLVLEAAASAPSPSPQPSPAGRSGSAMDAAATPSPRPSPASGRGSAMDTPAVAQPSSPLPPAGEGSGVRGPPPAGERSGVRAAVDDDGFKAAHASPSVRRFARELGVDLARVAGTGPNGRIQQQDVQAFVKGVLTGVVAGGAAVGAATGSGGLDLLPWPKVDFAKFGPVEAIPLSRIRKISGANLARNWVLIPHVTQFDEADITDLETLRVRLNEANAKSGVKVTMLAFLIKASVAALQKFPDFNASLDGENLVRKRYFHIGFAADTPNGLVVPVVKDADRKGVLEIAREMGALSAKAREGKLGPADMQGGCFSVSSLGGIGGTAFTPIINAPEVAILGVSKSATKPVWNGSEFVPRLLLPLSLSYDHRVIDGAAAARFTAFLAAVLADFRRVLL
ncbi:MAG: dihydrolipoyllysine-residue acetyltransferase [Betaproteobacteria bacterium]|nr:dihydrolipoyllysine-residue acetyltransferase [Betaproteobacteria bacterium]